jgi:hypothetical protein
MSFSMHFGVVDFLEPLTHARAKTMLEQAFAIDVETVPHEEVAAILFNINQIQEKLIAKSLDGVKLWHLLESDPNFGPFEEVFRRCPAGFTMLLLMAWVKRTLFTKLYPNVTYGASILDQSWMQFPLLRMVKWMVKWMVQHTQDDVTVMS